MISLEQNYIYNICKC